MNKPKAIDLFAGCGGFSLGLKKAGFQVIAAVEIDKWAAETYRHNHKDTIVLEEDIRQVTARHLLKIARIKKGELDLLVGGPPCQGFSIMNVNRSLNNPRSKLMYEFIRMAKGILPKIFEIENVPGMFSYNDFFILLMKTLERYGYVVRCLMMDAVSYGLPQYRKRIFIQGTRKDLNIIPTFPTPSYFDPKQLKLKKGQIFTAAEIATECFAVNGFMKEEVKDLYWNGKLDIQMNRKTAANVINLAINKLLGESIKSACIK